MGESATKCSEREGSAVLTGTYTHSIDTKNRLIIPAKLKEQLGTNITVIKDTDKCLCIYSEEEWRKYTATFENLTKSEAKVAARYIYSNAQQLQPDSQGRILIPQKMIEFAGITKNVVTVGCGKYVEIWAEERWNELNLEEEPDNFAEILAKLGL